MLALVVVLVSGLACAVTAIVVLQSRNISLRTARATQQTGLAEHHAFLSGVLASSTDCIKVLDLDGRIRFMSETGLQMMGISDFNSVEGCSWPEFYVGQGRTVAAAAIETARNGLPSSFLAQAPTTDGTLKWWHITVSPIMGPTGVPERILSVCRDVTALRSSEDERDHYARLIENSSDFIGMARLDGTPFFMNEAACRLVGLDRAELGHVNVADFFPPEQVEAVRTELFPTALRDGFWSGERLLRHFRTGELIPVLLTVFPVPGADGELIGFGTVTRVFREQKRAQEQLRMLNSELGHRLKNILTIMHTVVKQTLRESQNSTDAGIDISGRLMAMGAATDVLTAASWRSADLRPLAERSLALHDQPGRRIRIDGPDIRLNPQVGIAMALALHELGTNAIKHGALSAEEGGVELSWRIDETRGEQGRFHLEWTEFGGPEVQVPDRTGFGADLIERSLRSSCGGEAVLEWRPGGLRFVLSADLAKVAEPEPEPVAS